MHFQHRLVNLCASHTHPASSRGSSVQLNGTRAMPVPDHVRHPGSRDNCTHSTQPTMKQHNQRYDLPDDFQAQFYPAKLASFIVLQVPSGTRSLTGPYETNTCRSLSCLSVSSVHAMSPKSGGGRIPLIDDTSFRLTCRKPRNGQATARTLCRCPT